MRVYIAGPLTGGGDQAANVRRAIDAGQQVLTAGHEPLVPHLHATWEATHAESGEGPHLPQRFPVIDPNDYETWMRLVMAYLAVCQAVIRLPGVSPGSDREVARAGELGIPVFYSVEKFLSWAAAGGLP